MFIPKADKVVCLDTLLQMLILINLYRLLFLPLAGSSLLVCRATFRCGKRKRQLDAGAAGCGRNVI